MRLRLEMTTNKQAYHNRAQHHHKQTTNPPKLTGAYKRDNTWTTQTIGREQARPNRATSGKENIAENGSYPNIS